MDEIAKLKKLLQDKEDTISFLRDEVADLREQLVQAVYTTERIKKHRQFSRLSIEKYVTLKYFAQNFMDYLPDSYSLDYKRRLAHIACVAGNLQYIRIPGNITLIPLTYENISFRIRPRKDVVRKKAMSDSKKVPKPNSRRNSVVSKVNRLIDMDSELQLALDELNNC